MALLAPLSPYKHKGRNPLPLFSSPVNPIPSSVHWVLIDVVVVQGVGKMEFKFTPTPSSHPILDEEEAFVK